jgi:hypothetical protein
MSGALADGALRGCSMRAAFVDVSAWVRFSSEWVPYEAVVT